MLKDDTRTRQVKLRIFEQIESLLGQYTMQEITFAQIAKLCSCQPNSITYYFESKLDMLLQFTEYYIAKEKRELPQLRITPPGLSAVQRFCREIDILFSVSDRKPKPRLLSNYFILSNSPLHPEFQRYLSDAVIQEDQMYLEILHSYQQENILCETRFTAAYAELCFYTNAFSIFHIFDIPIWEYAAQLHNVKESLKASFLKDGLYTPDFTDISVPLQHPGGYAGGTQLRQPESDQLSQMPDMKKRVFAIIEELLEADRLNEITFSYLAKRCYCQPSSITYYFKSKMDMLLQFAVYYVENRLAASTGTAPKNGERLPTAEAFLQFLDSVFICAFHKSKVLYWVNYIVISNMPSAPKFSEYLRFSIHRKSRQYWEAITFYQEHGLLNEDAIPRAFSELTFFSNAFALLNIFQVPITEQELLLRTVRARLIAMFLKREFLPKGECG